MTWARSLGAERVWALEDCRHVSGAFERFLVGRGERVLRVPTRLMAEVRRGARQRGKSDSIDALAVARAALREGLEDLPTARLDGPELDLRLLVDHRERLVGQRVALNSTLQWHLHDLWPELEPAANIPSTAHILGGAVIGATAEQGVVNSGQRVHGYRNLLVCDGAAVPGRRRRQPFADHHRDGRASMSLIPAAPGGLPAGRRGQDQRIAIGSE